MTEFGIQPTGYVRKPLATILAEIEAAMITEFGPGVIQTPQSPFGQLNGLVADLVAEIDERNLDIYQSYDPDQAEGTRLDILGRLRLISRGDDNDADFRKAITNDGYARVDIQDLNRAIAGLDGVTYTQVFVNETGEATDYGLERGSVAVAVVGGDEAEIVDTMRNFIVPGIDTYGNRQVTSSIDGFCRSLNIIRPVDITVDLNVQITITEDRFGCPAPSIISIKQILIDEWENQKINGQDVSFYTIRKIIESKFSNVQVVTVTGARDSIQYVENQPVPIAFMEFGKLTDASLTMGIV